MIAAVAVAWGSSILGQRAATEQMEQRYFEIRNAVRRSSFPLTPSVARTLAQLTATQWITTDEKGLIETSTIELAELTSAPEKLTSLMGDSSAETLNEVSLDGVRYFAGEFDRFSGNNEPETDRVFILFDQKSILAASRRAAVLPLLTGLSTIVLISLMMFAISARLIRRLTRLESHVQTIAKGDFHPRLSQDGDDEIGRLSYAVNSMADQLQELWDQVNRQQSAKLLHQIAAGMAHQLRNTLTGSKMAMELHLETCRGDRIDEVQVALRQLEIAEDYVKRLTTLGSVDEVEKQPGSLWQCLDDVRSTHQSIAQHRRVDLQWSLPEELQSVSIADVPALTAAVSNLILNAIQAGDVVVAKATLENQNQFRITVRDNGDGVPESLSKSLFDPFVTDKPEGMGLGLPLVQRIAEQFNGSVTWRRESKQTVFEFIGERILSS